MICIRQKRLIQTDWGGVERCSSTCIGYVCGESYLQPYRARAPVDTNQWKCSLDFEVVELNSFCRSVPSVFFTLQLKLLGLGTSYFCNSSDLDVIQHKNNYFCTPSFSVSSITQHGKRSVSVPYRGMGFSWLVCLCNSGYFVRV